MGELGELLAADYDGLEPVLVAPLKSSTVFLVDLSRALHVHHEIDVVELAAYAGGRGGGVRLLKDVDTALVDRHVLVVEDVVDTGLTLHFLARTLQLRTPASLAAVTLLDRPYRRLVDDLPLRYVGFTVPDELFAGYGLGLEERWGRRRTCTSSPQPSSRPPPPKPRRGDLRVALAGQAPTDNPAGRRQRR